MPTSPTSFSVSDAPIRRAALRQLRRGGGGLSSPAVTEGGIILDFGELGIDRTELVAYSLDRRANIGSVAIFAAPRDKSDVMHAIVDRAVGHVVADVGCKQ